MMKAVEQPKAEYDASHHDLEAAEEGQPQRDSSILSRSHVPRPSTLCVVMTIVSLLVSVGVVTYFAVWDNSKSFQHWTDRFFASEKKLGKQSQNGETSVVRYDVGNWIYFILLCIIFIVNLTIVVPALSVILRRRCRSAAKKVEVARNLRPASIDAIVPCYLPNECEIIEETLWHLLKHLESPGELKLWMVYNTPRDMPEIEERLRAMAARDDLPQGRKLVVIRAEGSKSKAENINLVLPQLTAKYAIIYDADHHPDPESLMLLTEKMMRRKMACVQGSTYIRDLNSGWLARLIDAEFFVTHFVYFPIMRLLTRNAVFCGSNGLWQTELLQSTDFNPSMQTEDIDVSVRMLLQKHSIEFCPEARSGELAPVSFRALFKQRLRWAIGWDEVSLKLMQKLGRSDAQGTRKAAVAYVCWSRWFMQIVGLIAGIATPLLTFAQRFDSNLCHCGMATQFLQTCMFYFYITMVASCILEAIFQTRHRGCQSWIQVIFVAIFMAAGFFYIIIQALLITVSMFKINSGTVGGWVVTARSKQQPALQMKASAGGDEEAPELVGKINDDGLGSCQEESTSEGSTCKTEDDLSEPDHIDSNMGTEDPLQLETAPKGPA
jgi:cellulose synthase/poly-beta-1,6-N-acetylglucosamine synthase-like glycosyltransferase